MTRGHGGFKQKVVVHPGGCLGCISQLASARNLTVSFGQLAETEQRITVISQTSALLPGRSKDTSSSIRIHTLWLAYGVDR